MTEQEQIEEMAADISRNVYESCLDLPFADFRQFEYGCCTANVQSCLACRISRGLIAAGYRKQVVGEWTGSWDFKCSICNEYNEYATEYCPHCGAKNGKAVMINDTRICTEKNRTRNNEADYVLNFRG